VGSVDLNESWPPRLTTAPREPAVATVFLCRPGARRKDDRTKIDGLRFPWEECNRPANDRRLGGRLRASTDWVGTIIVRIGRTAKVVVDPGDDRTGRPIKYASAHDLRRSCAERLLAAYVPQTIIGRLLRHASWETTRRHDAVGDFQRQAGVLRELLGTMARTDKRKVRRKPLPDNE